MPDIVYGVVFYGIGIALLTVPFVIFLWVTSPSKWIHPVELDSPRDLKSKYGSKNDYLKN